MPSGAGGGFGGSFVATGNLVPSRFVKLDSGVTGHVAQAGGGDFPFGVTQQGTRNPSYSGLQDGYCATSGENVRVYLDEEECMLEVDAAYNPGQTLKPGTSGIGTATTADGDIYGAIQLDASTAANQLVKVRVRFGYRGA
jgi:hypothetical protein